MTELFLQLQAILWDPWVQVHQGPVHNVSWNLSLTKIDA